MTNTVGIGIIGGGLMGREVASALGRWFVAEKQRDWFRQVPGVQLVTGDHRVLLQSPDVDVVYVAVPHHLHEPIYLDVLRAGKDLLAEKPFGIDLKAARTVSEAARQ